jgi:uncharacterized protein (AIM24 family)
MFCTHCGARIPEGANFCVGCGAKAGATPAPSPAPPSMPLRAEPPAVKPLQTPPPQPPPVPPAAASSTCVWCGATVTGSDASCPRCGAALRVDRVVTESGWAELPGRKDMAKLHFGNSSCQIEGVYVPVADVNLAAGEGVYFTHHVLLWKDPQVNVTAMSLAGAWKRMFAGMPLIMTQAQGPGHIAFSKDDPGELIPVPLQPGQTLDVREHLFLAATSNVEYDWFQTGIWFTTQKGNETETHYPLGGFMDRFSAPRAPGLLLLHAAGNVFVRELGPGQTILVKPTALVFKDPAVQMHLHFERPGTMFQGWGSWGNRYIWLRLVGPGRVAVQSVFDRIEGESSNLSSFSYATEQIW